jgi:hypothetical protein
MKKVDAATTVTVDDMSTYTKDNVTLITVPEGTIDPELFRDPEAGSFLKFISRVDASGLFR